MSQKRKINLIRSETWLEDNFKDICSVLDRTIEDFVDDERIISIEVKKEDSGLSRFWIYIEKSSEKYPNKKDL